MKKFESLKKNRDFQSVYRRGKSRVNRSFVMMVRSNDLAFNRYGISVSKKVGNSVVRHRITRVVREVIRLHQQDVLPGHDIVIIARSQVSGCHYSDCERDVLHLLKLHHLFKEEAHI